MTSKKSKAASAKAASTKAASTKAASKTARQPKPLSDAADLAPGEMLGDTKVARIKRRASRVERWQSAVNKAVVARDDLDNAITELAELRSEFEDWRDNMPENMHGSPTYEKLDAVCDLDIDRDAVMDPLDFLDEADGMDLPLGFGRD